MFWQAISKDVLELGKEIVSDYDKVQTIDSSDYYGDYVLFRFRKQDIFRNHTKKGFLITGGFCTLNKKEVNHLLKCFTKASIKKLTYGNNDF